MASPSEIPNHPVVQVLDTQSDAFPTGASYHIKNLCSNFRQTLALNPDVPGGGTFTSTAQPSPDCKWLIQYENDDRSRVAFKSARNGLYLAITSPDCKSPMRLSEQIVFWWVHQGSAPGTYWFASTQSEDCFLHTWDCQQTEGSLVASFTNRDPKWGNFYNQPYSVFEEFSTGMSWGLDPTPELLQWKQQQKAVSEGQEKMQDDGQVKKREAAVVEKERLVKEREADFQRKKNELAKREQDVASKEQASDKRIQDLEKRLDDLKKREEAVRAAEDRIKKSKKGGQAEHLATQEEKDKLKDKTKDLQHELEEAKGQVIELKAELEKAGKAESTSRVSVLSGSKAFFSIRSPEVKRPLQKLPDIKPPGQALPERRRPGQSLPHGYNADMLKRYEAGRKAMAMSATA
jgi:hypothetical protein